MRRAMRRAEGPGTLESQSWQAAAHRERLGLAVPGQGKKAARRESRAESAERCGCGLCSAPSLTAVSSRRESMSVPSKHFQVEVIARCPEAIAWPLPKARESGRSA